jgi:hypothetical protein
LGDSKQIQHKLVSSILLEEDDTEFSSVGGTERTGSAFLMVSGAGCT